MAGHRSGRQPGPVPHIAERHSETKTTANAVVFFIGALSPHRSEFPSLHKFLVRKVPTGIPHT